MCPVINPTQDDPLQGPWELIELEELDIEFPEEVSSISSSGSMSSEVNVDFPEEDSSSSSSPYCHWDDDNCSCCHYFPTEEDEEEEEKLPGVDYKYTLEPTRSRNEGLNMRTYHGQACLTSFLHKEIIKAANVSRIQNAFPGLDEKAAVLGEMYLRYTTDSITLAFTSPIQKISTPANIQRMKNSELVKELPAIEETNQMLKETQSSVIAVNLNWKNSLELSEENDFIGRTRRLEPLMRKSRFAYRTKTKFAAHVKTTCDELFPEWRQNMVIINGHEGTAQISSSAYIQEDSHAQDHYTEGRGDPYTRYWKEYTDFKEHKILVVPHHSKRLGFDTDLSKHYEVPFEAKFIIGRRTYQHKFLFQLPLSRRPQHYGLIFTFSEDPKGLSKLRIKTLFTVYSIFPKSSELACLETYDTRNVDMATSESDSNDDDGCGGRHEQCTKAAKNAVQIIMDNLKEEKLAKEVFGRLAVDKNFVFKGQGAHVYKNDRDDWGPSKNGRKNNCRQDIKFILRDLDAFQDLDRTNVHGSYRSPAASFGYWEGAPLSCDDCMWCANHEKVDADYRPFRTRLEID